MATTVWRGHLTFGLVSIPVRLFKAGRAERVRLHQLRRTDPAPVKRGARSEAGSAAAVSPPPEPEYSRVKQAVYVPEPDGGAEHVEPISRKELAKGYEYAKDQYVVLDQEDLEKITPKTAAEMQILEFVRLAEIDPVYLETSYYMAPEEVGAKAYALLFQAMRESEYVALAEVAMHRREHVVLVRPGQKGIIAHTMFYADEIRSDLQYVTDVSQVSRKELDLALTLIRTLAAPFEPAKYKDKFREGVEALIAAKLEGKQVAAAPPATRSAEVVNIMDALQKSLAQARKPPASAAAASKKRGASRG